MTLDNFALRAQSTVLTQQQERQSGSVALRLVSLTCGCAWAGMCGESEGLAELAALPGHYNTLVPWKTSSYNMTSRTGSSHGVHVETWEYVPSHAEKDREIVL
jgi:hypothetical protein